MQRNISKALAAGADMSAVMPAVDPHTGDVLAMATSKPYGTAKNSTTLPIFTSYTAQGGSTYKLFPLLTALSTGVPSDWELQNADQGQPYAWQACPEDNGKVFNGDAHEFFNPGANDTLADATAKSSNTFYTGIADQLFGCNLQSIIDMASNLGMKSLSQPSGERGLTVAQQITKYSSATRLVLGDIATNPLELTAAYAAIANDGKYNAPAPILSVTDNKGKTITVPRSPSRQVVAPQVARQAVAILKGDTRSPGTSADEFSQWYAQGGSDVAGKTGTAPGRDPKTGKDDKNGALWFTGMTPDLVATTALINLDNPSLEASDLPNITNEKDNAFGEYAAGVWLKTLHTALAGHPWSWPSADGVPGTQVPDVVGQSPSDARATLRREGFRMQVLDAADGLSCASDQTVPGVIAYYGPQTATRGSTITVCPASGTKQTVYVPPPPPKPTPHKSKTRSSSSNTGGGHGGGHGGGNGGGNGGGRRTGTPPGRGNGG